MKITILTTFPEMFPGPLAHSIVGRALKNKQLELEVLNLREFTEDLHRSTDDRPYGGGPGMIMMIEPIAKALDHLQVKKGQNDSRIVLMSAKGAEYTQQEAQAYAQLQHLVLLCGHYEGVDERVAEQLVDQEIRIGSYVLTGGELASMVIADSVTRLLPDVLGEQKSLEQESHTTAGYLEYPQYTRPASYNGWKVPEVLLGGNHKEIITWREQHATTPTVQEHPQES